MFAFNRGYLCCGCTKRFSAVESAYTYKNTCICKGCYSKFNPFNEKTCFEAVENIDFLTPVFHYGGLFREIFLNYKFNGATAYGHILGRAMTDIIGKSTLFEEYSYIIPMPVSKTRMRKRGYNQSLILAEYLSSCLNIPIRQSLERVKNSTPQSKMKRRERESNVKNAFAVNEKFNGERVILFDDLYTTGSTMKECAVELLHSGVKSVCGVVLGCKHREYVSPIIHRFHKDFY